MIFSFKSDPFKQLKREIGKAKVMTDPASISVYGMDATIGRGSAICVTFPENTDDVISIVKFASERLIPITPRGSGSGLSGGSIPSNGSIVMSFERMRQILSFEPEKHLSIVQPGVITADFQNEVIKYGLFYPPDPSSHTVSTIGGNVAENAGGLRCFKYGVTSQYVLGIEFVNPDGEIQKTGILSNSIYEPDLTYVMVGSEGTLGIFTKIALRLIPLPEYTYTLCGYYSSPSTALGIMDELVGTGVLPSVMEFMDDVSLNAVSKYIEHTIPVGSEALLLLELDGKRTEVEEQIPIVKSLLEKESLNIETADLKIHRDKLWNLRRNISPSLSTMSSGKVHEDISVPRGSLKKMVKKVQDIRTTSGLNIAVYGHCGDGNLHIVVMFDSNSSEQVKKAKQTAESIMRNALALGGSISGEHGVGLTKNAYINWQLSEEVLSLMKQTKKTLDPENIFNPEKIFPK